MILYGGVAPVESTWSLREVAVACGRSLGTVAGLAAAGLLPGSTSAARRQLMQRSPEVGEAFVRVLRNGAYSREWATLVRSNPTEALATVRAQETLVRASLAARTSQPRLDERAA